MTGLGSLAEVAHVHSRAGLSLSGSQESVFVLGAPPCEPVREDPVG